MIITVKKTYKITTNALTQNGFTKLVDRNLDIDDGADPGNAVGAVMKWAEEDDHNETLRAGALWLKVEVDEDIYEWDENHHEWSMES